MHNKTIYNKWYLYIQSIFVKIQAKDPACLTGFPTILLIRSHFSYIFRYLRALLKVDIHIVSTLLLCSNGWKSWHSLNSFPDIAQICLMAVNYVRQPISRDVCVWLLWSAECIGGMCVCIIADVSSHTAA